MIEKLIRLITVERVDDIPLLLAQLERMQVAVLLDKHFPVHGPWAGELTFGEVAVVWIAFIVSEGDHRLNHLEIWAAQHLQMLQVCLGKQVRALDFSDDRLADMLEVLSDLQAWRGFECELNQTTLRVYELPAHTVRLDATTTKTYAGVDEEGLFQFGHSKDHRPDLAQVKVQLSTLDPLGLPLTTTIIGGQSADDPLYVPEIKHVQQTLGTGGKTYIGDCKMGALGTRAYLAQSRDYYLCPLAGKQMPAEALAQLIEPVTTGEQALQPIFAPAGGGRKKSGQVAEGYEYEVELQAEVDGQTIEWRERRLVVRSLQQAAQQRHSLDQRLQQALAKIAQLNERKQGKKRLTESELLFAAERIVAQQRVAGLLKLEVETVQTQTPVRRYGEREARVKQESQSTVKAQPEEAAVAAAKALFGWHVYATNHTVAVWTLAMVVLAYRGQYLVERGFGRLKGKALALSPLFLRGDNRVVGLLHLLVIALRVLTLIEFVVRRQLKAAGAALGGLYVGNPQRATSRPTTERLLEAFEGVSLTWVEITGEVVGLLSPLSELQERILQLLGFSSDLYLRLVHQFSNLQVLQFLKPAPT
jgi:transposase